MMNFKLLGLFLVLFSFLVACKEQSSQETFQTVAFKQEVMEDFHLKEEEYLEGVKLGLIVENDTRCSEATILAAQLVLPPQIDSLKRTSDVLLAEMSWLYRLIGDPVGAFETTEPLKIYDLDLLLSQLQLGYYTPQCEEISFISKEYFKNASPEIEVRVVRINTVEHTLNLAIFEENNENFFVFFDVQNGFLYPSKDSAKLSIPSYQEFVSSQNEAYYFTWLEDSVLLEKRNLTNLILPCGFMPQLGRNYRFCQGGSKYKYELLGPSFHKVLWFDLGLLNQNELKKELDELLLTIAI